MASEKMVNYTAEQTAEMVQAYQQGQTVEAIASSLGKSVRSIVAKLSREKVYVAKSKTGSSRVTKVEMVGRIAAWVGVEAEQLASLEKASHEALEVLLAKASGN
jgi:putative heme iron utilization protein